MRSVRLESLMTSNETLQLNPLETAEAIHSAGWRQGSVSLPSETLAIPFSFDPATEVLVILTQSCSSYLQDLM